MPHISHTGRNAVLKYKCRCRVKNHKEWIGALLGPLQDLRQRGVHMDHLHFPGDVIHHVHGLQDMDLLAARNPDPTAMKFGLVS